MFRDRAGCAAILLVPALVSGSAIVTKGPGSARIASNQRRPWPGGIRSKADFDTASFAENIGFACSFFELTEAWRAGRLDPGVKHPNRESIERWIGRTTSMLVANLQQAALGINGAAAPGCCPLDGKNALASYCRAQFSCLREHFPGWATEAAQFHAAYAREQFRLAALFPNPTSEILPLDSRELLGGELPDRHFLLTFDDGPTSRSGTTDEVMKFLRSKGMNGLFFVLQDPLVHRLNASSAQEMTDLYQGMHVGSHGRQHTPRLALNAWKASILGLRALIQQAFPLQRAEVPFRPPYGQRTVAVTQFAGMTGDRVVLWNIDSLDWNRELSADRVRDRVVTLMLLWRKGIILFHDTHPKVIAVLPGVVETFRGSGIIWVNYEHFPITHPCR